MPLELSMNALGQRADPMLAAAAARGNAETAAAPAQQAAQGSFSAHLSLTLYDANGRKRNVEDGAPALRSAPLADDAAAVIEVDSADGDVAVTLRKDGTFTAVQHGGGALRYDSRDGEPQDGALVAFAARARSIAAVAGSGGTSTALSEAASGNLVSQAAGPGGAAGVTVTVTDADGVSRYVGGPGGVVSASRTTARTELETVTSDAGLVTDAVRARDGSGTTTVSGGALGAARFVLTRDAHGKEDVAVTNGGGTGGGSCAADAAVTDAFGDLITVGRDANGRANIGVTDAAGDAFDFRADGAGTSESLTAAVRVGGTSGTAAVELAEDATAATTTGSTVHGASAFEATATDAQHDGTISLAIDGGVYSQRHVKDLRATKDASASLHVRASAAGTVDVAGAANGGVTDGYPDASGVPHGVAETSREGGGAASLQGAAERTIAEIDAQTVDRDERSADPADVRHDSLTTDDATLSVGAFGHTEFADRHDVFDVEHGKLRAELS